MEALDGVIGDTPQRVCEPSLGVDTIQPRRADQGIDGGGTLAATVGAGEEPGVAPEGNAAQGAFGGVVGEADAPVLKKPGKGRTSA
jgi:hypothetical protein